MRTLMRTFKFFFNESFTLKTIIFYSLYMSSSETDSDINSVEIDTDFYISKCKRLSKENEQLKNENELLKSYKMIYKCINLNNVIAIKHSNGKINVVTIKATENDIKNLSDDSELMNKLVSMNSENYISLVIKEQT